MYIWQLLFGHVEKRRPMTKLAYFEWIFDMNRQFRNKESVYWGNWDSPPVTGNEAFDILDEFHQDQCAICGCKGGLVLDHCHESDLVRAYLCKSCNVQEGKGGGLPFSIYRRFCPAALLNIEIHYSDYSHFGHTYWDPNKFMTKEAKQVNQWSDDRCLQVYRDYLYWRVDLQWMSKREFREFLRRVNEIIIKSIQQVDEPLYEQIREKMNPFQMKSL